MLAIRSLLRRLSSHFPGLDSLFWLALILIVGVTLRLFRIGANSLWFDETFSWLVARQPAWAILTQRLAPIMPPLYHFLLNFWIRPGESEALLRSFSATCGVITILVMYFGGRELFTPSVGLTAALLTAVLPFHVYFAQEARPYALIILLSALMLYAFIRAWKSSSYGAWIVFGLLAGLSLYAHYFVVFSLAVFHGFVFLNRSHTWRWWPGLLLADMVAFIIAIPQLPSAWAQTQEVTTNFWLSVPTPLHPIKTLVFLLFGHTTPFSLVPVVLFLTLSIFVLIIMAIIRAQGDTRRWLLMLLALVLVPMLLALLISWTISPIYLDRSFSLITPAYILLLSWGLVHPPRGSPLPFLFGGLAIIAAICLGNHYLYPDPAKPPFRAVGVVLKSNWQQEDVLLNLHDSSYLPLQYYVPELESYLLNNDPDTWIPAHTWEWAGDRVSRLDEVVVAKSRLWLLVMPDRVNDRQTEVLARVESRYEMKREWIWPSVVDPVKLRLYSLEDAGMRNSSATP